MSISSSLIGGVVRRTRENAEMSREGLAASASVPVEALAALEDGTALLSTAKLDRIARTLEIDPLALLEGSAVRRPSASMFFRHAGPPDLFDEDVPRLTVALEAATALLDVNTALGRPPGLRSQFVPEPVGVVPYDDGYHVARRVRVSLGNMVEPLGDLRALLEDRFDITVSVAPLRTRRVQAVALKRGEAAAVVLNSKAPRAQSPLVARVTLAHELSHVLLDVDNREINCVIDLDDTEEARTIAASEQRARAFAAELLLPLLGLKHRFGDPTGIDTPTRARALVGEVRAEFSTPVEIAVNHLMNHGYLHRDERFRQDLLRDINAAPSPAHQAVGPSLPLEDAGSLALLERVREAHDRTLITDGRARELLGLSVWDALPWDVAR